MMDRSFVLKFFSSTRLDWNQLRLIADATTRLAGADRLRGEWTTDSSAEVRPILDLNSCFRQRELSWRGCLTMVFGDDAGVSGRWDLLNLQPHRGTALSGTAAGYRMHEFSLEIQRSRRGDAVLIDAIFQYFVQMSSALQVNFALGHDNDGSLKSLYPARGLEAGLPGVYRLTTFGLPFVSLAGEKRFAVLPVERQQFLEGGGVAIQLGRNLAEDLPTDEESIRERVKNAIGHEYFLRRHDADSGIARLSGGRVGALSFLRAVFQEKKLQEEEMAVVAPSLDWSGVFAREKE